jgi:peptidylprolyl isomerase
LFSQGKVEKMAQAKKGDTVKVHYTGKLEDGSEFDSSAGRNPLQFTLGGGKIIPGFEKAVLGMSPGESKTATIPADQAYGPHQEELVWDVDRERFPDNINPELGLQLEVRQADNQEVNVVVTGVSESSVRLDANHPLAGRDLIFDIQLMEIA